MDKYDSQTLQVMQWLLKKKIRSISPEIGILLVDIRDKVRREIENDKNLPGDIKVLLWGYSHSLDVVATMAAIHQAAVIGQLEAIVKQAEKKSDNQVI